MQFFGSQRCCVQHLVGISLWLVQGCRGFLPLPDPSSVIDIARRKTDPLRGVQTYYRFAHTPIKAHTSSTSWREEIKRTVVLGLEVTLAPCERNLAPFGRG